MVFYWALGLPNSFIVCNRSCLVGFLLHIGLWPFSYLRFMLVVVTGALYSFLRNKFLRSAPEGTVLRSWTFLIWKMVVTLLCHCCVKSHLFGFCRLVLGYNFVGRGMVGGDVEKYWFMAPLCLCWTVYVEGQKCCELGIQLISGNLLISVYLFIAVRFIYTGMRFIYIFIFISFL